MAGTATTLRLMMPQWQGGDNGMLHPGRVYPLGARLLAFLGPESDAPLVEVPVEPFTGAERRIENGVAWQDTVLRQTRAARAVIDQHRPERIIMFGGDCLVSQAPFAYLNERYEGDVAILWIDAHPDVTTSRHYEGSHAYVLGNLLGDGDPLLAKEVARPYRPDQALLVGVHDTLAHETETIGRLGLAGVAAADIADDSAAVLDWLRAGGFGHVAIHLDLDVLSPAVFHSQFPWNSLDDAVPPAAKGRMTFPQLTRLIKDVAAAAHVAGFTLAEHLPWDAYHLTAMMDAFNFMK